MFDIRERVLKGEFVAGTWCSLGSPAAAEITALCGFDWVLLDAEHAPSTTAGIMSQMQAVSRFATAPIVRVPWLDRVAVKWSLDIGAAGIMVPYVETVEQAREAVSFMRYAPEGVRGVAGATRASVGFGALQYSRRRTGVRSPSPRWKPASPWTTAAPSPPWTAWTCSSSARWT